MKSQLSILLLVIMMVFCTSPSATTDNENQSPETPSSSTEQISQADTMQADQDPPPSSADPYWDLYRADPTRRPFYDKRTKYRIQYTLTADTMSADERARVSITGSLSWQLDHRYRPVVATLSFTETYVDVDDEYAYETSESPLYLAFYYDTLQAIEYIHYNGLLSTTPSGTYWGNIDDKTARQVTLNLQVPNLIDDFKTLNTRLLSYNVVPRHGTHDLMISSSYTSDINTSVAELLKQYLTMGDSLASNPTYSQWFKSRTYYQRDLASSELSFEAGDVTIRPIDDKLSVVGLMDHLLQQADKIRTAPNDTIRNYYWTSENGTNVRRYAVWPVVRLGDQHWLTVNKGYAYPRNLLGYKYSFEGRADACPEGWHVPTRSEWGTLFEHLGGRAKAAKALISDNPMYWSGSKNSYNETGFNVIQTNREQPVATFLTSTLGEDSSMYVVRFSAKDNGRPQVVFDKAPLAHRYHCRCVKDSE